MTFALEKIGENANVTEIAQGTQLSFRLFIHFTNGTTDMTVEIFTPANQTTIMILCPPIISYVGSNLQINEVTPVLESKSQTALVSAPYSFLFLSSLFYCQDKPQI